jgi:hypothetical protein
VRGSVTGTTSSSAVLRLDGGRDGGLRRSSSTWTVIVVLLLVMVVVWQVTILGRRDGRMVVRVRWWTSRRRIVGRGLQISRVPVHRRRRIGHGRRVTTTGATVDIAAARMMMRVLPMMVRRW